MVFVVDSSQPTLLKYFGSYGINEVGTVSRTGPYFADLPTAIAKVISTSCVLH